MKTIRRRDKIFGAVIDTKNVTIRIQDGTGTPNFIEAKLGAGNLTYEEKRNMEYILDRGLLDTVREGDQVPMDVRLDSQWENLTGGSGGGAVPTIEDAMKRRGPAAAWVSTSVDPCEPYAVDIEILNDQPCGGTADETILLPDFRWESANHDMRGGTVSFSGKCNATQATVTRGTITS